MLYFVVVWLILLGVCWLIGITTLKGLQADQIKRRGDRWMAAIWLGLVLLAIALLATSLVWPLSPIVGGGIMAGLGLVCLLLPHTRSELLEVWVSLKQHPKLVKLGLLLGGLIAAFTTQRVTWIDTGLYHYSAIHWLSEFGAVPGLVLLLRIFGFTSAWFALAAPFNPVSLGGRACAVTNGFVVFLVALHLLISLFYLHQKRATLTDWFALGFLTLTFSLILSTRLLSTVLVSASPDISLIGLIGIIAWLILLIAPLKPQPPVFPGLLGVNPDLGPLVLAIGAVSIKLIALPLVPVCFLFYLCNRGIQVGKLLTGSVLSLILLLPILRFNIITSGCPLYPSEIGCFNLPWRIAVEESRSLLANTQGWTTWFGEASQQKLVHQILWQWLTSIGSSVLIVLLFILSLGVAAYVIKKAGRDWRNSGMLWVAGLALSGSVFTLVNAPLLRFSMGYIAILPAIGFAILGQKYAPLLRLPAFAPGLNPLRAFPAVSKVLALLSTALVAVVLLHFVSPRLLLPPELPWSPAIQQQINDVVYFVPQNKRHVCWATPLPCSGSPDPGLKLYNPSLGVKGGFKK